MSKKSRKRQEKFLVRALAARLESLNSILRYPLGPPARSTIPGSVRRAHIGCIEPSLQVGHTKHRIARLYFEARQVWRMARRAGCLNLFAKMIAACHDFYRLPRHPSKHHSIGVIGSIGSFLAGGVS